MSAPNTFAFPTPERRRAPKLAALPPLAAPVLTAAAVDELFGPLSPLDADYCEVPFPADALPEPVHAMVAATAGSLQVPVDMPAVMALGAAATIARGRIQVRYGPDYVEPTNLFVVVAAESGERKSAAQRQMLRPVFDLEARHNEQNREAILQSEARVATLDAAVERAKRALGSPKTTDYYAAEADLIEAKRARADYAAFRPLRLTQECPREWWDLSLVPDLR